MLLPFSAYGFNKSHTAGYGLVSYWTAYLKANYPAEYMAALLTSVGTNKDKMAVYLAETRRMGVKVLPPDVNESQLRFAAVGDDIRFGLGAIRNVGENVVDGIIPARTAQGRYASFNDFLGKVPLPVCNKRVVESLVKAGAFDSLGHPRKGLILVHEQAVDAVISVKRNEAIGQDSLFGPMDGPAEAGSALEMPIPDSEWSQQDTLAFEREMLGLYVSSHPLDGAEALLERSRDHSIADLLDGAGGNGSVRIAGIITSVTKKVTKQGNVWALVGIEDHEAAIEVACFPNTYQLYAQALIPDAVVSVTGKIRKSETSDGNTTVSFSAEQIEVLDVSAAQNGALPPVVLNVREDRITPDLTDELKRILQAHPGNAPVHMHVTRPGRPGGRASTSRCSTSSPPTASWPTSSPCSARPRSAAVGRPGPQRSAAWRPRRTDRMPRGARASWAFLDSSSGSRSSGLAALATTSCAISVTRDPRDRAAPRSRSNASRGRSRCRSASTPMACSTRTRDASACSSWATVTASRSASWGSLVTSTAGSGPVLLRRGAGGPGGRRGRAVGVHRLEHPGVVVDRLVGGEQVREHHRAGQVGDVLLADDPAALGLAHDHIVGLPMPRCPVLAHACPASPAGYHRPPATHYPYNATDPELRS